ncbi:glycoside hydrolase family 43 protein [Didymella exigua CBS 183.55]|uniref:Glycoside hydrolase family 43 protein n=1 Tax=Didymella exigua CBS 183.55 TaxID=1150837 RepID=A0A6A5RXF5_9PLEO|nr:glycoside hydrolase family 43 protein [Didymella exigua CBS 183.55]KAF1931904.1 glycoside hydrolase family 43 protein [Didymella exigua CBS 183.55]
MTLLSTCATSNPLNSLRSRTETFDNPAVWQDYPDLDVFRVRDIPYYSSSTFAFSTGAPVLKSFDLYRESTDTFHWIGCIAGGSSYVWTASGTNAAANNGEVRDWSWFSREILPRCYYDNGLPIDDDGTMYIAYGSATVNVAQLNAVSTAEVKNQAVYTSSDVTKPADDEYVLKVDNVRGSDERQILGDVVSTKDVQWYYMAFLDAYPGGRIPVVTPPTWTEDGWPQVMETVPSKTGLDSFEGPTLSYECEWSHNPDGSVWSFVSDMRLRTATVTNDLFTAHNTLTRRILGPKSAGTFRVDISGLKDGDRAGAVLFRVVAAYIGNHRSGNSSSLFMVEKLDLGTNWVTNLAGTVAAAVLTLGANATKI